MLNKSIGELALLSLATYRATVLVIEDEITSPVRDKVFEKFPPQSTKLGYLLTCPWCVSIWAGAGLLALEYAAPQIGNSVQKVLAASAVTGMINTRF